MILDLLRRLPSGLLARLRRSAVARTVARRILLPFFPEIVTIGRGALRGLRMRRQGALVSYLLGIDEPGVQAVCERLVAPGCVAWDVGANVGFITLALARLAGPSGRVVAFEPRPDAAALVRANAALNRFAHVDVRECAASDSTGRATFHVRGMAPTSGLAVSGVPDVRTLEVATTRLDDLAGIPAPDFVKMDIEGSEVEALKGMARLLAGKRPVLAIENHGRTGEVAAILRAAGYLIQVLGRSDEFPHAPWNSIAVAVPEERAELLERTLPIRERR
ncbi:MAG: FkbM family methyltransferase [Planctomycetes bacterium]|nr:FkbM family methyltransferase [Planctomycetota bacterium]